VSSDLGDLPRIFETIRARADEGVSRPIQSSAFLPKLLWNRGIAALCDWRIPDEFPDGTSYLPYSGPDGNIQADTPADIILNPDRYADIEHGHLVWVRVAWLKAFVHQVLPRTKAGFTLLTGASVSSVPSDVEPYATEILNHPNVRFWYAQNCDDVDRQGKLRPLPIGIDYHTLSQRPFWGESIADPWSQECALRTVAGLLPANEQRIREVYLDFAWQPVDYGGRFHILRSLAKNSAVHFQNAALAQTAMWRTRGDYAFVGSPYGIGLDCHRTWEALALGHIVIVPRSPLETLFRGLAVVSIDDTSEITRSNLSRWQQMLGPLTSCLDRIETRQWIDRIRFETINRKGE
jgi:hypothetical protein